MRLLLGLALGLALMAQPAAAGPREGKEEKKEAKAERKEQRSEPSAPAPADAAPPERAPLVAAGVPEEKKAKPAKPRQNRRLQTQPQPEPTPTASPSPTPVPAPNVPSAPAVPAAPVPAAQTPAPTAAPERPKRPARRERKPRRAVLGFTAGASSAARAVPVATALAPFPRLRRPARIVTPRRQKPRAAAPDPGVSPATAAVTRVVNVIPAPIRLALIALIMLVVLLTVRARRLESQRQDLSEDLGLLQSALLPAIPERIGQAWISAAYRPAEGLAAGGDFYDAFALDAHRTCLLVGDVAGHGRDAIPITADVRFTLRAYLEAGMAPRAALRATAAVIGPRLGGRLVTVVVAVFDSRTGRLAFAAAGHPPPLFAGIDDRLVTVASSPAIGAGAPTGHRQTTVTLPAGATACFYTDGLGDAKAGRRRIGPDGVAQHLASLGRRANARDLVDRIVRVTDSQPDDMAVCLVRPQLGTSVAAQERVEELELERPDDGRAMRFLVACGVPAGEAEAALEAAHDLLPVVLEVRCGAGLASVAVHRPDTAACPVPTTSA